MKKLIYITAIIIVGITNLAIAQNVSDQNPNSNSSAEKYTVLAVTANNTQGVTVQNTYKVTDWREVKLEKQELKATRKHELKKLRLEAKKENRVYRNASPYYRQDRNSRRNRCNRQSRPYYGNNSYNNNTPYYYNY